MARLMVPSTAASRGEVDPDEYLLQLSVEELRRAAAEAGFELVAVAPDTAGDVPTVGNTKAEIEAYAEVAGIDLGAAKTKADMIAVIEEHATQPQPPPGD